MSASVPPDAALDAVLDEVADRLAARILARMREALEGAPGPSGGPSTPRRSTAPMAPAPSSQARPGRPRVRDAVLSDRRLGAPLTVAELARKIGTSEASVYKAVRELDGVLVTDFVGKGRARRRVYEIAE